MNGTKLPKGPAWVLGLCMALGGAFGQEAAPVTSLSLSLSELTQAALKNSPKLESARLFFLSAQSEAHSAGRPSIPAFHFRETTFTTPPSPNCS